MESGCPRGVHGRCLAGDQSRRLDRDVGEGEVLDGKDEIVTVRPGHVEVVGRERDHVRGPGAGENGDVVAAAADQTVVAVRADERVGARVAVERVVAGLALEEVRCRVAR